MNQSLNTLNLGNDYELPPLPAATQRLCAIAGDPDADIPQMVRIVESDAALAARILGVANSAFYGLSHKVGNIGQAFFVLGTHTVRNLAMGLSVITSLKPTGQAAPHTEYLWQHSIATAIAAQTAANGLSSPHADHAFVAGMLHDIGKLVLLQAFPEKYSQLLTEPGQTGVALLNREQAVLGVCHAEIGASICERWKLPAIIGEAVAHHDGPFKEQAKNSLTRIVFIANNLAHIAYPAYDQTGCLPENFVQFLASETQPPSLHRNIIRIIKSEITEMAELLGFCIASESTDLSRGSKLFSVNIDNPIVHELLILNLLSMGHEVVPEQEADNQVILLSDHAASSLADGNQPVIDLSLHAPELIKDTTAYYTPTQVRKTLDACLQHTASVLQDRGPGL